MRLRAAALLLSVAAHGEDVAELLARLVRVSANLPVAAHVDTLISAAELLPVGETRLRLLQTSISLLDGVREEEPRYFYLAGTAQLLAAHDGPAAEQLCLRIPTRQSAKWRTDYRGRCWQFLATRAKNRNEIVRKGLEAGGFQIPAVLDWIQDEPATAPEALQLLMRAFPGRAAGADDVSLLKKAIAAVEPMNAALAAQAATLLLQVPAQPKPEETDENETPETDRAEELFQAANDPALTPGELSTRMARVMEETQRMAPSTRRLELQAYLSNWFTAEGITGLATKAVGLLEESIGPCTMETCLERLDELAEFAAKNNIDMDRLHVRSAALEARLLLRELRKQVER